MLFITIYVGRKHVYSPQCNIDFVLLHDLAPTFNQSQRVWCVFFSFFTENRVHS